jgi:hypothetical protein
MRFTTKDTKEEFETALDPFLVSIGAMRLLAVSVP